MRLGGIAPALLIAGTSGAASCAAAATLVAIKLDLPTPPAPTAFARVNPNPPLRPGAVRFAVADNVDLFVKVKKDKPLGEPLGRRGSEPAGQSKAVRLGVAIRW